ncbi:MAG TPA: HlyD family efflux transporter periplasmic adaptor subunit [Pseudonocardia sp.]|nr:HlyD family efflux transporter periplasmic adaptor subunit [Pseudonocardia sp.]
MSLPAPPAAPSPPPPQTRSGLWQRLRGARRRTLLINIGLALLVVIILVFALMTAFAPRENPNPVRTVAVTRGTVTASVTASGNSESSLATPVSFVTNGVLKTVDVKPGDVVTTGQVLATIDPASAQTTLDTALAQLANAQAALAQAQAGPTDIKRQQDALAVTQAQQSVDAANDTLSTARKQKDLDQTSTDTAIKNAQAKLDTDTRAQNALVNTAEQNLRSCQQAPPTTTPTTASAGVASTGSSPTSNDCTSQKNALTNARNTRTSTLQADQQAITTAKQNQKNTLLNDQKAIDSAEAQVTSAESNVKSAQLSQQANLHPQTPEQIAQARANVDSAQVSVDSAQRGVNETTLVAPQDGKVLSVANKVGEVTTGGSSLGSSGTTSGGSANAAANTAATSSGTGFIVIANPSQLAVTANIAEADAAKVQLGQAARITFPATSATATGTVTQITPQSTVSNNVVQYPVQVSLATAPPGIGVGNTASLSITTGTKSGVLVAPTSAITSTGNRHTVVVRRGDQDVTVPVEIGIVGDTTTEIVGGVNEGDQLVLPTVATSTNNGFPRGGGGGGGGG